MPLCSERPAADRARRGTFYRVLAAGVLLALGCRPGGQLPNYDTVRGKPDPQALRSVSTGTLVGFEDRKHTHAWLGIPYAAPPVGPLRWRAPRPAAAWAGARSSVRFGAPCPQIGNPISATPHSTQGQVVGSEDCLTLNVWSRAHAPEDVPRGAQRRPVMVWIHGGGNSIGTSATYESVRNLVAKHDVVVVTVNYRLGVLGWFRHPALESDGETPEDRSGNYGTLDLLQALGWVKENISVFGGDPGNVTLFGESAGGMNIYALLVSPLAKGLFHRAIAQSGLPSSYAVSEAQNYRDAPEPGHQLSSRELVNELLQRDRETVLPIA